jgi:hypothetical protein
MSEICAGTGEKDTGAQGANKTSRMPRTCFSCGSPVEGIETFLQITQWDIGRLLALYRGDFDAVPCLSCAAILPVRPGVALNIHNQLFASEPAWQGQPIASATSLSAAVKIFSDLDRLREAAWPRLVENSAPLQPVEALEKDDLAKARLVEWRTLTPQAFAGAALAIARNAKTQIGMPPSYSELMPILAPLGRVQGLAADAVASRDRPRTALDAEPIGHRSVGARALADGRLAFAIVLHDFPALHSTLNPSKITTPVVSLILAACAWTRSSTVRRRSGSAELNSPLRPRCSDATHLIICSDTRGLPGFTVYAIPLLQRVDRNELQIQPDADRGLRLAQLDDLSEVDVREQIADRRVAILGRPRPRDGRDDQVAQLRLVTLGDSEPAVLENALHARLDRAVLHLISSTSRVATT